MENHLEREEVNEAVKNGYGESERYSSTLTEKTIYCAKRLNDKTILRVSANYVFVNYSTYKNIGLIGNTNRHTNTQQNREKIVKL